MRTHQALDIVEIQQLLARYVFAIDAKDFDRLDAVFTEDAVIDYTATGGVVVAYAGLKRWLAQALSAFPLTQHHIGLPLIDLDGNRAKARTMLFNPMLQRVEDGEQMFFVGGTYVDDLVRTPSGWRIARRVEADAWVKTFTA